MEVETGPAFPVALLRYFSVRESAAVYLREFGAQRPKISGAGQLRLSSFEELLCHRRCPAGFRAEAFNLTNTPAFGFPGATVGTSQFDVISSTLPGTDARQIQFALN